MGVIAKALVVIVGLVVVLLAALFIYNAIATASGKQAVSVLGSPTVPDQAPLPLDGKTKTTIPAANAPITQGADNGVQFWMFIKDWDYQFGKKKYVSGKRKPSSGVAERTNASASKRQRRRCQ